MRRVRRPLPALTLAIALAHPAWAEPSLPLMSMPPLSSSVLSQGEKESLQRLIASSVSEAGLYRLEAAVAVGPGGDSLAGSDPDAAETATVFLASSLESIGGLYVLSLELSFSGRPDRLVAAHSGTGLNEVVLEAKALTARLLKEAAAVAALATHPSPSLELLSGSWKGDKGLGTVRIFPDGRAVAVLLWGGVMQLRVRIEGNRIRIEQAQPNAPSMYRSESVSLELARRIAALARPMAWTFSLSEDGRSLFGIKESVAVDGSGEDLSVDNGYTRPAEWRLSSR